MDVRGLSKCRFVGGKYAGFKGYVDSSQLSDSETIYVVVLRPARTGGQKTTWVQTSQVRLETSAAPNSYAEATMKQCPDIEKSIVQVTRKIAKCDIGRDQKGFEKILIDELSEAKKWMEDKGPKALYRKVNHEDHGGEYSESVSSQFGMQT